MTRCKPSLLVDDYQQQRQSDSQSQSLFSQNLSDTETESEIKFERPQAEIPETQPKETSSSEGETETEPPSGSDDFFTYQWESVLVEADTPPKKRFPHLRFQHLVRISPVKSYLQMKK
ncbi:uncharacterized protein LOC130048616 [Ostrea edulis]|uniref:uncharacterized protein LOC130048616 n=1 Tax=Ostrea edulis TaxID=37623 RepID=UPI0024AED494|nr:uncharacterized protein LOC130048616 [Ostrea edulis]